MILKVFLGKVLYVVDMDSNLFSKHFIKTKLIRVSESLKISPYGN